MSGYNDNISLEALVFGCTLGDAYINRYGAITIEHSFFQAKYLQWKFEHFKRLGVLTPESQPKLVRRIHPKTNLITQSLRFNTKSRFKPERKWFYPEGSKVLPVNFEKYCDAACLAIWFMDDDGRGANTPLGLVLDVTSYTASDVERISHFFRSKLNIVTAVHRHGPKAAKLYIKRQSVICFCELIRPYIPQFMLYKLVV